MRVVRYESSSVIGRIVSFAAAVLACAPHVARAQNEPVESDPDPKATCLESHEQAQVLRMDAKLLEARAAASRCAQRSCPPAVVDDCLRWRSELQSLVPSIILTAKSDAGDEPEVRVYIDGKLVTAKLDGRPIELDPGTYAVRFVWANRAPVLQTVVLHESEQHRPVVADFRTKSDAPSQRGTPVRPTPAAVYLLGAIGVAGLATSAGFALSTRSARNDAESSCAPLCDDATVDDVRSKALVADVAAGIGIVGLGLAGYLYWTRPTEYRPIVAPSSSGLLIGVGGTY